MRNVVDDRLLGRPGLDERLDVLLGHPAVAAGARDLPDVEAVLGHHAGDHGADEGAAVALVGTAVGRRRRRGGGGRRGCGLGCWGGGSALRGRLRSRLRGGRAAARVDHGDAGVDGHRLALVREDLTDHARCRRRHLGVHLVGRDLDDRLVGLHVVAHLLGPAGDRALGHAHAHLGHYDIDDGSGGHGGDTPRVALSKRIASRWRRRRPPPGAGMPFPATAQRGPASRAT